MKVVIVHALEADDKKANYSFSMANELKLYREQAILERALAASTTLPNVRERALRSAERWDELAARGERIQAGIAERKGR